MIVNPENDFNSIERLIELDLYDEAFELNPPQHGNFNNNRTVRVENTLIQMKITIRASFALIRVYMI